MFRSHRSAWTTLLIAGLLVTGAVLPVPDVQYTTVTTFSMAGAAGKAMNFLARLGGGSTETTETVYLSGNKMLTKGDQTSTLIDLDARRMVSIDHEERTYTVMSFDALMRQMEQLAEKGAEAVEQAEAEAEEELASSETDGSTADDQPDVETSVSFDVHVNPTGKTSSISGYAAENYLMTISALTEATVEEDGKEETYEGTLVIASDLWLSKEFEGFEEVEGFNRRFSEALGESFVESSASMASAMQQALAGDPRMQEGMEKAQIEAAKLDGAEVKNTTYLVIVAEGETFNPDLLFAEKPQAEKKEKKRGGLLGRIARQVAAAEQQPEEEPAEAPAQQVLFTLTTEMRDVSTAAIPSSVFEIPSDYREVSFGGN